MLDPNANTAHYASVMDVNETNLHQLLEQSMQLPVLFYFWSERSQHCQALTPVLHKLAQEYAGQFILAQVDCDAEQRVAAQFGLHSIPTVYLFKDGQPLDDFQGPQPEEAIRELLQRVLPREEELKVAEAQQRIQEGDLLAAQRYRPDAGRSADSVEPQRRCASGTGHHPVAGSGHALSQSGGTD